MPGARPTSNRSNSIARSDLPLRTKLYIPLVCHNLVARQRLTSRLNESLTHPLTLNSAPAGFGKTTLLSEWLINLESETVPYKRGWVSLDSGDNDPMRFLRYVVAAVQMTAPDVGETALALLSSPQPPPIETILTALLDDLLSLPGELMLVFDDYHVIDAADVHKAVTFLLDNAPPQMHLIVVTRAEPPLPLALWRTRDLLAEIRADDLRFTFDEIAAFINQAMGSSLAPEDIATLEDRTEGWIAGIQMAVLALQGTLSAQGSKGVSNFIRDFKGSHRYIIDYLTDEVLNRQSDLVRSFLLQTSILDRMNGPLCNALTGRTDGQAALEELERANLFLVPLDDERQWYRYHHLFGDLLRVRLMQTQADLAPQLHSRASAWYESAGFAEEAIAHALAGKDWERAANLVESHAGHTSVHNLVTLSGWIEALPVESVQSRPWLCVYRAWTHYWTGRREQVEEHLQMAEQAIERRGQTITEVDQRHLFGHIAAVRSHHALTAQDIPRVLEMSHRALELLPEGDDMRSETAVALGGAYWGLGDVVAAQQAFTMARTNALKGGHAALAVSASCYVGMQLTKQARLHEAYETYRQALEMAKWLGGKLMPIAGFSLVKLGDVLREWNDLEKASQHLTKGVDLCLQLGQADVLADGYVALARLQLAQANLADAADTLQKAGEIVQRVNIDPFVQCWLDDCRVRFWLCQNDLGSAIRWAQASGLTVDGELSYHYDLHHINLARVLVAQGVRQSSRQHLDEAMSLLARLETTASKAGWANEEIKIMLLQGIALQAQGKSDQALAILARALGLAEPGGYVRTIIDEGAPVAALLIRLSRSKTVSESAYCTRLLAVFGAQKSKTAPQLLSERELQILRLLAEAKSYQDIAKELVISLSTVQSYIRKIYQKLDAHSGLEAVARARQLKLL